MRVTPKKSPIVNLMVQVKIRWWIIWLMRIIGAMVFIGVISQKNAVLVIDRLLKSGVYIGPITEVKCE